MRYYITRNKREGFSNVRCFYSEITAFIADTTISWRNTRSLINPIDTTLIIRIHIADMFQEWNKNNYIIRSKVKSKIPNNQERKNDRYTYLNIISGSSNYKEMKEEYIIVIS